LENEEKFKSIKAEILGEESDEDGSESESDDESDEDESTINDFITKSRAHVYL
jgi:pre-mRNA-splicing factor CWC22